MHPLRIALAGLVDYAGLFPPAGLDLAAVVGNVQRYAEGPEGWMLGRLVLPLDALAACAALVERGPAPSLEPRWTASVLVPQGSDLPAVGPAVETFNRAVAGHGVAVVAVETPADDPEVVRAVADEVPDTLERYVEVGIGPSLEALLDRVAAAGCYAKVRTGGLTADRIPTTAALARFVVACHTREVPFKATAGLHHPLRAPHPLTYERHSPVAPMHGFVNVVTAAALLHAQLLDPARVADVLEEGDPGAFVPETGRLCWRDVSVGTAELADSRSHLFRSAGSCSFEEGVEGLRQLQWLP